MNNNLLLLSAVHGYSIVLSLTLFDAHNDARREIAQPQGHALCKRLLPHYPTHELERVVACSQN
ncbi:hypothetical protein E2553_27690 [Paraburkholderia dipogonis]|uniref:Uncharacterized protein n=1 Tax=Paraburkholderia dipogonis TaxID=1211383 RepID=A0A4Y8MSX0_9BURK|nr:hypothetical protein [Paraburkholderia dipogonis]TFE40519.1 hypothetical protein E2553_27690 [Paraburkholderia dipogonis]